MVLRVYCVASGGIPLFHRSSGTGNTLSFSELAPLNGIQVFGKVYSVSFHRTEGKDFTIHWKTFTEKLSLILISKHIPCHDGELVLNCVFDAMVLTVGIDELSTVKHVDRLKKEIRPCYPFVDEILKSADEYTENQHSLFFLSMVEVLPNINSCILQEKLDEWSANISSLFYCLFANKKIVVASSAWWDLTAVEKYLLSLMVVINNNCTTIDIPVFLPNKSPKTAFRLISCCLIADVWITALCGPTPLITEFEQSAAICWSSVVEYLKEIPNSIPQIIPNNLNTQNGITGLILMNYRVGKYVCLGSIANNKIDLDTVRIFYYQNISELIKENDEHNSCKARETFWYSENYKLYGLINDPHVMCLVTSSVVPTPTVRLIAKDLFASTVNSKLLNW